MATSDPQVLDPKFTLTPDQYAESERLKLEGDYPTFDRPLSSFQPAAEGEYKPYYSSLFNQLGLMEKQATEKSFSTYDDLVKKLTDQYNRRGTFFSGEAVNAETGLAKDQAANVEGIRAGYDTKRQAATLQATDDITKRAQALQQQAFDEYQTVKKGTIEKQVSQKLAEYIPGYADAVQQQVADANSPWLEIPLEEGVDWSNLPGSPTTTSTGTPSKYGRFLTPEEAKSGKYKGKTVTIPGSGIRFKSPADEPGGGKTAYGRFLTPAEAKSGKYKGKTVTIPGSGIRFKSKADEPK